MGIKREKIQEKMEGAEEKPDISDTATSVYDSHPPLLPLIEDIKHIPFLWYRKHRDFNNTPVKDAEYERLGLRHNMTGLFDIIFY